LPEDAAQRPIRERPDGLTVEDMPSKTMLSGKYEILDKVGQGGMGTVYRVRHQGLDKILALKVLPQELGNEAELVKRFGREARLLARLDHRNIVRVFDFEKDDDTYYLVMEFLQGRSLGQLMREPGANAHPLPLAEVLRIGVEVADALAYAHGHAVIHRDIKPSNIIVEDGTGRVVVTDFGIAKLLEPAQAESTQTGLFVGTVKYSAPEQLKDPLAVDARADVYGLGMVLYELAAGRQYFAGLSTEEVIGKVLYEPGENAVSLPGVPSELVGIVERAIARDREARYPTAEALAAALRHCLAAAPEAGAAAAPRTPPAAEDDDATVASAAVGVATQPPEDDAATVVGEPVKSSRLGSFAWLGNLWKQLTASRVPPARARPERSERLADDSTVIVETRPRATSEPVDALSRTMETLAPSGDATMIFQVPLANPEGAAIAPVEWTSDVAVTIANCSDPVYVGRKINLDHFPFCIGRAALSFDPGISVTHAEVDFRDGRFTIRDLGSANGTLVNGRRLPEGAAEELLFGARITIGTATELVFVSNALEDIPDLAGEVIGERFTLGTKLHTSARAAVYTAEDAKLLKTVVIKVLAPGLARNAAYREQFEREALLASRLQHTNVCAVIDYGVTTLGRGDRRESRYVCMEYMEGGSLSRRLAGNQPVEPLQVAAWLDRISDALDYVHGQQIVHGSIKPSAIVFDAAGSPYLTDFSLATVAGGTSQRAVLGAPGFLAPEQWAGAEPVPATDQYSLAVLTYLLLTGVLPYEAQDRQEMRERNLLLGPVPVNEMAAQRQRPPLPAAVGPVLTRALCADPNARYASTKEFALAFREALTNVQGNVARRPAVFISYQRSTGSPWAWLFKNSLEQRHNYEILVDFEQRDKVGPFPKKLERYIQRCDVFVCILGESTLASAWVQREILLASQAGRPMIPVFQESFRAPTDLAGMEAHVQELLNSDGIKLLDLQNVYVDEALQRLGQSIKQLVA
jgi:serine/threonine protein kinase